MADEWSIWKPSTWWAKAPTPPGRPPAPDAPPPTRRPGLLGWLASFAGGWPGPEAAAADLKRPGPEEQDGPDGGPFEWRSAAREVGRERVNSGPAGVVLPAFLPWLDDQTGETQQARHAYRRMLANPDIKSALLSKILPVCALDLNIHPEDGDDPEDVALAEFVLWCLTRRVHGGLPGVLWDILIGGLVDGFSVLEKVWAPQERGRYAGRWVLAALKPKQVGDDVVALTDQYRNIIGVRGLRYNAGEEWPPERFVIFRHLPLYGSPVGMSDLRAAYQSFWMLDTAKKLRSVAMESRAVPVAVGKYKTTSQKPSLDAALALFRSQNYITVPEDVQVEVIQAAGSADAIFDNFERSRVEEIYRGINGASLQALEGKTAGGRGDSRVHEGTAEVRQWHLAAGVAAVFNDHDSGLVRDIVDLNCTLPGHREYPTAKLGAVRAADLASDMEIDSKLKGLGVPLSLKAIRKKYNAAAPDPDDPEDTLAPQGAGGGPQDGPGGLAGLMGGGDPKEDGATPEGDPGESGGDDPFSLRGGAA